MIFSSRASDVHGSQMTVGDELPDVVLLDPEVLRYIADLEPSAPLRLHGCKAVDDIGRLVPMPATSWRGCVDAPSFQELA